METDKEMETITIDLLELLGSGISPTWATMLILFDRGMTTTEVRKVLDTSSVLMSINLKKMRKKGILTTKINQKDRRYIKVKVTEKGNELIKRIRG